MPIPWTLLRFRSPLPEFLLAGIGMSVAVHIDKEKEGRKQAWLVAYW